MQKRIYKSSKLVLAIFIICLILGTLLLKDGFARRVENHSSETLGYREIGTPVPDEVSPEPSVEPYSGEVSPEPSLSPSPSISPTLTLSPTPSPQILPAVSPTPPALAELSPEEQKARAGNRKSLANLIDSYVRNDPAWRAAEVGIFVATVDRQNIIYEKNGNLPMIPASNLKVITSAAALALLGPDYRFETSVHGGEIDKETGIMQGNLYLRGTGDPTFMKPFTSNPTEIFHGFARILKKRGIKVIEGDIVGDDSAFDREFLGRGWKSRYLLEDYAAPAGALSINGNCITIVYNNGTISMQPGNRYIQISYRSDSGGLRVNRQLGTDRITVLGSAYGIIYRSLTINNPSNFTTSVFAQVLKAHNIKIKGKVRLIGPEDEQYQKDCQKIAFHNSIPLNKIVREINKESDNICAQHVFKAIGHVVKGKGTCDNSNEAIKDWMKEIGVDFTGVAMADGSGLSVYNRISPRQMCEVLRFMTIHPQWKNFWASLPIAGKDGTLDCRMYGIPVRAKTGGLQGHIALSGYVQTKAGQIVVFSILTNKHQHWGDRIRQNEDYIVKLIAKCTKKL